MIFFCAWNKSLRRHSCDIDFMLNRNIVTLCIDNTDHSYKRTEYSKTKIMSQFTYAYSLFTHNSSVTDRLEVVSSRCLRYYTGWPQKHTLISHTYNMINRVHNHSIFVSTFIKISKFHMRNNRHSWALIGTHRHLMCAPRDAQHMSRR